MESESIAPTIDQILAGEGVAEQMDACFLDASLAVILGDRQPQSVFREHTPIFITKEIIGVLTPSDAHIAPQDIDHSRAERDDLYLAVLGVAEYHLTVGQHHITILDIADGGGAAATVQQEVDDDPIPIFAELTIGVRASKKRLQFVVGIGIFDSLLLLDVRDSDMDDVFSPAPVQKC